MTGHAHAEHGSGKRIALLIAIPALFLAVAETGAKSAQTEGISRNLKAANLRGPLPGADHPADHG